MKRLYFIPVILALLSAHMLQAQEEGAPQRRTPQAGRGNRTETKASDLPALTVRAQDMNERLTQNVGNARWVRTLYRELDLTKEANAPLYYPVRPINGSKNLFSIIFELMSEGKLTAYKYEDGYEAFDDDHLVNFKEDVLDRAYIFYEEVPAQVGGKSSLVINESDIPSADVLTYYIKEAWYFDQNNSLFDVKTLAVCPILTAAGDFSEQRTTPLFWLPYENIRPYISTAFIMTSNVNNAKTFTIDDYFRRRMFQGDIIKTENLMNKTLQESFPEPDSLQFARDSIEKQLTAFEKSLWVQPDTAKAKVSAGKGKKSDKSDKSEKQTITSVRGKSAAATVKKEKSTSGKTPAPPKAEKSSAVRSVRRTR
ncbi:gliding motility associated protein GldN [Bacteroidales bacterium Barb6]|nr:gliding motility associated protein GldN [Bacteroidales bacterium Barb6]